LNYSDLVSFNGTCNLLTISILFTLGIQHLLIFLGRKKYKRERFNVYFSVFLIGLAAYLATPLIVKVYLLSKPDLSWIVIFEAIFIGISLYSLIQFLSLFIEMPRQYSKWYPFSYAGIGITIVLASTAFIYGERWYEANLFMYAIASIALASGIFIFLFLKWIIKSKAYQNPSVKLIVIGFLFIILNLIISKIILAINGNYASIVNNHLSVAIVALIFTQALARKINIEFDELNTLKVSLEEEVAQRTNELNSALKELEQSSRQKSLFFTNLAHEIKTPLTLISNYFEKFIKRNGANQETEIIKQNLFKLTNDINNYFDSEKISKGHILYNHEQTTLLSEIIEITIPLVENIAKDKAISCELEIEPNICIAADSVAIDRLLFNLFDNALKYCSLNGKIKVSLVENSNSLDLMVCNTGSEISLEQQEHLFSPYYQINIGKKNTQGIGMGLYIVKNIVESLNGKISVSSNAEFAVCFTISFPASITVKGTQAFNTNYCNNQLFASDSNITIKDSVFDENKKTVLLVEDNKQMLAYLADELSEHFNVYIALNGKKALQKIQTIPHPNLIISDIMMDEMDGIEFYNSIAEQKLYSTIPFIFLTAKSSDTDKIDGLQLGVIDYIAKPFNIEEIIIKAQSIILYSINQRKSGLKQAINCIEKELVSDLNPVPEHSRTDLQKSTTEQYKITKRQKEIAEFIREGLEYKEIGNKLHISHKTVIRHVQNMFENTNTHNKMELMNALFTPPTDR